MSPETVAMLMFTFLGLAMIVACVLGCSECRNSPDWAGANSIASTYKMDKREADPELLPSEDPETMSVPMKTMTGSQFMRTLTRSAPSKHSAYAHLDDGVLGTENV